MNEYWKKTCDGCRHLNAQEPNQHCYMFRDAPDGVCMQHTEIMAAAKRDGKVVRQDQIKILVTGSKK